MAAILEEYGVPTRTLTTERPGYVVYEDDFQVVAEPFRGEHADRGVRLPVEADEGAAGRHVRGWRQERGSYIFSPGGQSPLALRGMSPGAVHSLWIV